MKATETVGLGEGSGIGCNTSKKKRRRCTVNAINNENDERVIN